MNWKEHKSDIVAIIELIEDKHYPARRNITDYVCSIFGYPKDLEEFIESEYKKYPEPVSKPTEEIPGFEGTMEALDKLKI